MSTLKEQSEDFFAQYRARGGKTTTFDCPSCGETNETIVNNVDSTVWDSLCNCVHCNEAFIKYTHPNCGPVEIQLLKVAL